ncbi:MAG: hypothetical protein JSS07_01450 [Proteobacteria bacterium]|nr:hypothetical protein [Pseudomonadota bacterium]
MLNNNTQDLLAQKEELKKTLDAIEKEVVNAFTAFLRIRDRKSETDTSAMKKAIQHLIKQLQDVSLYINPEQRVKQYGIIIDDLLQNPQNYFSGFEPRYAASDFESNKESRWYEFAFNTSQKMALFKHLDKLEKIQTKINQLQPVTPAPSHPLPVIAKERAGHRYTRETILEDNLKATRELKKILSKTTEAKTRYKEIKSTVLSSFKKTHLTKVEILDNLVAKFDAIKRAADPNKNKENLNTTAENLQTKIKKAVAEFEEERKNRVVLDPFAADPLANVANKMLGSLAIGLIDDVLEVIENHPLQPGTQQNEKKAIDECVTHLKDIRNLISKLNEARDNSQLEPFKKARAGIVGRIEFCNSLLPNITDKHLSKSIEAQLANIKSVIPILDNSELKKAKSAKP